MASNLTGGRDDRPPVRVRVGIDVQFAAGVHFEDIVEIPRVEWDALSPADREKRLAGIARETLAEEVYAYAHIVEE